MKKSKAKPKRPIKLRKRTEELLNKNSAVIKKIPPRDVRNLLEDLQIYQIELEKYNNELQKAHEDLQESEEKYRLLVETMSDDFGIQDKNGLTTYVNDKICKKLNYKSDEFVGRPVTYFLDERNKQILKEQIDKRRNDEVKSYELEWTGRDGNQVPTIMSPQAIFDEKGDFKGSFAVITNISDRKQAEELLRESEKFSSNLLNNSPHPILVINPDTLVRYVNPALETLTGFSSEDIVGRKAPYPWWTEESVQKTGEDLKEAMRKGAKKLEELFQKKNGKRFWVEITSVPIRENGAFKYYLANWVDITNRKQAEEALRENEGKFNAMLQSIGDHMSMIDKDLNIIWANKIAKEVFGVDIIGKKCYEVHHQRKEPCEPYPCITLKAFQDGKVHEHDTQVIDKDGKKIFFHCTANVALKDKEGKPTAVLEISSDTTAHKQAELSLIEKGKELENKTHELEEVNAALRVLLKHRDEDKKDLEEKVVANVKKLVFPYVEKLNNSRLNDVQMVYLNIIKSNLEDIITPFLHQLSSKYSDLTPNEIQVAGFVKEGKTTKEIAELLNSSTGAINFHRNNLRKKLGLRNTKTNLRSFLLPLA